MTTSFLPRRQPRTEFKRWSKDVKILLLRIVEKNISRFEKPTAQLYYRKIIEDYPIFNAFGWKGMRDKMRNLRINYTKAKEWKNNAVLDTEEAEAETREHLLRLCEDFDVLDKIFKAKEGLNPFKHLQEINDNEDTLEYLEIPLLTTTATKGSSAQPSSSKVRRLDNENDIMLHYMTEYQKEKKLQMKEKIALEEKKLKFEEETFQFNKAIEERRLKLEEEKFALERLKFEEEIRLRELEGQRNYELRKAKLDNELKLKEMELQFMCKKE